MDVPCPPKSSSPEAASRASRRAATSTLGSRTDSALALSASGDDLLFALLALDADARLSDEPPKLLSVDLRHARGERHVALRCDQQPPYVVGLKTEQHLFA